MSEQPRPAAEDARDVFERWEGYVARARAELGDSAALEELITRAALHWTDAEPPELWFVPETLRGLLRAERHETAESTFLERSERGEIVARRRRADGDVVYLTPEQFEAMGPEERAEFAPYDPLLARALRAYALDSDLERLEREVTE